MASGSMKFSNFRPDSAGIAAIFTSAAMQSACKSAADSVTASCNAAEAGNFASLPAKTRGILNKENRNADAYTDYVKVLSNTAIGIVSVHNKRGAYDENQHHTLEGFL